MMKAALHNAQHFSGRRRASHQNLTQKYGSIDWEITLLKTRQVFP